MTTSSSPFLIDTHAHLVDPKIYEKIDLVLANAKNEKVHKIVSIGCALADFDKVCALSVKYTQIFPALGLYPHDTVKEHSISDNEKLERLEKYVKNNQVVAIGECGLDFSTPPPWEIKRPPEKQIELFQKQIELAIKFQLPVIIHSRKAAEETLSIIEKYRVNKHFRAVWHCFSENIETASEALNNGIYLSFTGLITYPKFSNLREVAKITPKEKIMIETDTPYLVPSEAKAANVKINEPCYVKIVAEKLAESINISYNEFASQTAANAERFFKI